MTTPVIEVFNPSSAEEIEVQSGDVAIVVEPTVVIELVESTPAASQPGVIELPAKSVAVLSTESPVVGLVEYAKPSVALLTPLPGVADTVEVVVAGPQGPPGIQGETGRSGIFVQAAPPAAPQFNDIWIMTPS